MHFDTFYQFFIYSKNWAYIMMFITLPLFVVFCNKILYPTQDKEVRAIIDKIKGKFCFCKCRCSKKKAD